MYLIMEMLQGGELLDAVLEKVGGWWEGLLPCRRLLLLPVGVCCWRVLEQQAGWAAACCCDHGAAARAALGGS